MQRATPIKLDVMQRNCGRLLRLTMTSVLACSLLVLTLHALQPVPAAQAAFDLSRHYVAANATGNHDGSSWTDAYTDLQAALAVADAGDEIWVAAGIYYPGTTRAATFQLKNDVALYGGFAGHETAREQRDWQNHPSVLSGDVDQNDVVDARGVVTDASGIRGSNSYHVVTGAGGSIDGFFITAGNADGTDRDRYGGGMVNDHASPTLSNITLIGNQAGVSSPYHDGGGGGMANFTSSPHMSHVAFINNVSQNSGGGVLGFEESHLQLDDVSFRGNQAHESGGGMEIVYDCSATLRQVTFTDNRAAASGAIHSHSSDLNFTDVTLERNEATYTGGAMWTSGGNLRFERVAFVGNQSGGDGGGLFIFEGRSAILIDVVFRHNQAGINGGGLVTYNNTRAHLVNVTFAGNHAARNGGGMFNLKAADVTLANTIFSGNHATDRGGGLYNNESTPTLTHVTFSGNQARNGGGLYDFTQSGTLLQNSIFWGNQAANGPSLVSNGSTPTIQASIIEGGVPPNTTDGGQNLFVDPQFVRNPDCGVDGCGNNPATPAVEESSNDDYGDLRLQPGSQAIDAGDNSLLPPDTFDLDGDGDKSEPLPVDLDGSRRVVDGDGDGTATVDMGAYEFCPGATCLGSPSPPPSSSPSPLQLSLFTTEPVAGGGVTLQWETETEADNRGFNLYRVATNDGTTTKVNAELIPAQGSSETGAVYEFVDRPGSGDYIYLIKNIDQQGMEHLRGQVEVVAEGGMLFVPALSAP